MYCLGRWASWASVKNSFIASRSLGARCSGPDTSAPSNPPPRMDRRNAAGQVAIGHTREAGRADHLGELLLLGEPADALDQVAVGICIAGRELAEARDHL